MRIEGSEGRNGRAVRRAIGLAVAGALIVGVPGVHAAKRKPRPAPPTVVVAPPLARPTPFSSGPQAAIAPPGWMLEPIPKAKRPTRYDLVPDDGVLVLRAYARDAAASLRHGLYADPARTPLLRWRWRTDHVLDTADMTKRDGDDYAARLYVFFARDEETLSLKEKTLLKIGRARYGNALPTAALCYVWDNRQPVDTLQDNAYTGFVKMIVATSGTAEQGRWVRLQRDVAADYRRAFGTEPPRITGVAVAVDTDNTGETTTTWFGDIDFVGRPSP